MEGNVLTLPAVRHEDAGVYACTAANHRGQETAYYALKVRGEDGRTDRRTDRWMGRGGGGDVPPLPLTPPSPQSAWSPISGRRRAPSSRCPPSRTPTRGSRSSSPSDRTRPTVSAGGTPGSPPCPLHVPSMSHSFPSPASLHPSILFLFPTVQPSAPPHLVGVPPPSRGCLGVPQGCHPPHPPLGCPPSYLPH